MLSAISYYATLLLEAIIGVFGTRLYEEAPYEVLARISGNVEIRRYAPRLAAEVDVPGQGKAGTSEAFQLLFAYIAGANRAASAKAEKMAMTIPVELRKSERVAMTMPVQTSGDADSYKMLFYLPGRYARDSAPLPTDSRVKLVRVPDQTIAILRYSGSGSDFPERKAELVARLQQSAWRDVGTPYVLSYDAPITLPFLRRNEAAVAVAAKS